MGLEGVVWDSQGGRLRIGKIKAVGPGGTLIIFEGNGDADSRTIITPEGSEEYCKGLKNGEQIMVVTSGENLRTGYDVLAIVPFDEKRAYIRYK